MDKRELCIDYSIYEKSSPAEYGKLCSQAHEAAKKAYSIYSGFSVGAAVLLDNGVVITANNQENVAYPSGLCAERIALFYAHASYPDATVKAIAITALKSGEQVAHYITPCGACRQVFEETINRLGDFDVIMTGKDCTLVVKASGLLPFAFTFPSPK